MKPKYTHDCSQCTFLGTVKRKEVWYDFYHCNKSIYKGGTIIYRDGNEAWEYGSCPVSIITVFNSIACLGLGLYFDHLGVNEWNGPKVSGTGFKGNEIVIEINNK